MLVYQVDNRFGRDKALDYASSTVELSATSCGANYLRIGENVGEGFLPSSKKSYYYSKWAVLEKRLSLANDGEIIVYVDSDMVAKKDGLSSLRELIEKNPEKKFFATATITVFNGGIFALVVDKETRKLFERLFTRMKQGEYPATFNTKFGEKELLDEVPIIYAILNNDYNFCRLMHFLDSEIYNCMPQGIFPKDEPDFLPSPSVKTKFMHYAGEKGKEKLLALMKGAE